jgi:hypothetical protein
MAWPSESGTEWGLASEAGLERSSAWELPSLSAWKSALVLASMPVLELA